MGDLILKQRTPRAKASTICEADQPVVDIKMYFSLIPNINYLIVRGIQLRFRQIASRRYTKGENFSLIGGEEVHGKRKHPVQR